MPADAGARTAVQWAMPRSEAEIPQAEAVRLHKSGDANGSVGGRPSPAKPRLKAAVSATRYMFREQKAAAKAVKKRSVRFNPEGSFRHAWDMSIGVVLLCIGVVLPFRVGFQVKIEIWTFLGICAQITDIMFVVDIILNFNTGYELPNGQIEMGRKKARLYYFRHWFWIDLAASLPVRYVAWVMENKDSDDGQIIKVIKALRLLRLAHLMRLWKLKRQWEQHKEEFAGLEKAGKLLACAFAMIYACHLIACMWFYFGTKGQDGPIGAPGGWIETHWHQHTHGKGGTFAQVGNFERYITSLYWAITVLSTVGFGEIHPSTNTEKVFSTVAELAGCFIFMVLLGILSRVVTAQSPIDHKVSVAMDEAREFLVSVTSHHSLPLPLPLPVSGPFTYCSSLWLPLLTWSLTN